MQVVYSALIDEDKKLVPTLASLVDCIRLSNCISNQSSRISEQIWFFRRPDTGFIVIQYWTKSSFYGPRTISLIEALDMEESMHNRERLISFFCKDLFGNAIISYVSHQKARNSSLKRSVRKQTFKLVPHAPC